MTPFTAFAALSRECESESFLREILVRNVRATSDKTQFRLLSKNFSRYSGYSSKGRETRERTFDLASVNNKHERDTAHVAQLEIGDANKDA